MLPSLYQFNVKCVMNFTYSMRTIPSNALMSLKDIQVIEPLKEGFHQMCEIDNVHLSSLQKILITLSFTQFFGQTGEKAVLIANESSKGHFIIVIFDVLYVN